MLEPIDRDFRAISQGFEASPNEQSTGNMIALDTTLATLTGLNPRQLFELTVKLLTNVNHPG